jgi:LytS/YehU family sensor histidine kinase
MRFQDRLHVEINVEKETLEAQIPNLILQPIVENAVLHGIAARAASGRIEIRAWHKAGQLWLQVRDDGPGLKTSPIPEGIGLANTRARLQQLYGREQKFELCNADDVGTVATISLPFHNQTVRATR